MERQVQDEQRSPTHMSDDMSNTLHPSSHSTSPPHGHGSDGNGGIGHDFHRPERRVSNYGAPTSYSPPSYTYSQHVHDHDPATLNFPHAPSTELAPLQLNAQEHNVNYLPPLASLTSPSSASSGHGGLSSTTRDTSSYSPPPRPPLWPSGNPYSAYYNAHSGQSADSPAGADPDAMLRRENRGNQASSVSLDDPDVRVAAEALGDLKTSNFVSSPRNRASNLPSHHLGAAPSEAEPLLSLIMTSNSLFKTPIERSVLAYNKTKNIITPDVMKAPVQYFEGVVGSGLQYSGIEPRVRSFFEGRQRSPTDIEAGEISHKRRRINTSSRSPAPRRGPDFAPITRTNSEVVDADDVASIDMDRRLSMSTVDSLPAYDDARSPAYSEGAVVTMGRSEMDGHVTPTAPRTSSTSTTPTATARRFFISTSCLGIAMKKDSLRSLRFCLNWLRWANEHIKGLINNLKDAVERYDQGRIRLSEDHVMHDDPTTTPSEQARHVLKARLVTLRNDVVKTLEGVIDMVSKHLGGALPDNARVLVGSYLRSTPARFLLATRQSRGSASPAPSSSPGGSASAEEDGQDKEVRAIAHKALAIAKEGLLMMGQVSEVVQGTLENAEEWCDTLARLGRNDQAEEGRAHQEGEHQANQPHAMPVDFRR